MKKKAIIIIICLLAVAGVAYFMNMETPESLEKKYPDIRRIHTLFKNNSKANGTRLEDDIKRYLDWSSMTGNAPKDPPRTSYAAAINYDPAIALKHAKILGII